MDIEMQSKILREKIEQKKNNENPDVVKNRMKTVLSVRDMAMQQIYDYQDKTGVPTKEEADKNFFEIEIKEEN